MSRDVKQIILGALILVFGILSWFLLHQFLYFGNSATFLILAILGFLFFGVSLGIGSLLINNSTILYSVFVSICPKPAFFFDFFPRCQIDYLLFDSSDFNFCFFNCLSTMGQIRRKGKDKTEFLADF